MSVFFDGQLVYRADERITTTGANHSNNIPIGNRNIGNHTLTFRLDSYNGTLSEVNISNVQFSKITEAYTKPRRSSWKRALLQSLTR